jgi:TPR repeat protein
MSNESKRRRPDPPAREAPSVDVDDDVSPGDALRLLLARFEKQEEKLERVREEHVETRAELTATRRALAELTDVVKSMNPTFDVNEQLASVVFSHVTDVRTRVALSQVNTVWRRASKVASAQPDALDLRPEMLEWYQKGARHGNTECESIVGTLYFHGVGGVEKNFDTALRYFEKAAAKGHAAAQSGVGSCHFEMGRYEEAFKWYTKSAAQGYVDAEHNLGVLYEDGRGVTKDISKAIEWYTKAAEKGDAFAAKRLRRLIELGSSIGLTQSAA